MRRLPHKTDTERTLVALWLCGKYPSIIAALESGLRRVGFAAHTSAGPNSILTHVYREGEHRGSIDVARILVDIAMMGSKGPTNLVHEADKIRHAVADRIEVVQTLFGDGEEGTMERLQALSKQRNIKIRVVRPL